MTAMPARIEALRLGVLADAARRRPRTLIVAGVFESTFHIAGDDVLLAVGGPDMGNGPLNVVCCAVPHGGWLGAGVVAGRRCAMDSNELRLAGGPAIGLGRAIVWQPRPWPAAVPGALAKGFEALHAASTGHLPGDGLAALVLAPAQSPDTALARIAAPRIAALRRWLADAIGDDGRDASPNGAVRGLIGLGPGLTPSGDDLLSGAMLALHAAGRHDLAARIAVAIEAAGPGASTPLARAFHAAAAAGCPGEVVHDAITALLAGQGDWPDLVRRTGGIGHTSGWDTLAGVVLAFDPLRRHSSSSIP